MRDSDRRAGLARDLRAVGFIALLTLAWLWPVTVGGRLLTPVDMLMVMQPWQAHARELGFRRVQMPFLDAAQQHWPWRKFAGEELRKGEIPLWNPYAFCGMPFVGNNQSAVFYPETWLFALMPPERAFGWAALLSLVMGGAFMYAFLRVLGLRRVAAVGGTIPFVMSGFIVGWLLLPTIRAVPMWLPLMLLAYEKALKAAGETPAPRGGLGWVATCGLAIGMQFLAGHLHVSLLVMMVFGAYVVFRVLFSPPAPLHEMERGEKATALGRAVLAVVLGAMLAAIQLLPVLELVGMNPRKAGQDFADVAANRMMPVQFLTGLMPNLFGSPVDYNFWGTILSPTRREFVETVWYYGVVAVLLAGAALAWKRTRSGQTWFWAGVWLGGAGMAWGTVVYWVVYTLIPPLRQLPGVSRGVFLCCFAGAVLAALGVEAVCRQVEAGEGTRVKRLAGVWGTVLALVALAGGLGVWMYSGALEQTLPGIGGYTLAQMGRCLALVVAGGAALAAVVWKQRVGLALLLAVMAVDLLQFAGHLTPEVPAKYANVRSEVVEFLQARTANGRPDRSVGRTADGNGRPDRSVGRTAAGNGPWRVTSFIGDGKTGFDRMPPNTPMACGLEDVQGSDSLVFDGYANLWAELPKDSRGNPDPASPVLDWLNCKYVVTSLDLSDVPGWKLALDAECKVWENTEALPRAYFARPGHAGVTPLGIEAYEPNRVVATGRAPQGAEIVLADAFYPGWQVYVDGRQQDLRVVQGLLRGTAGPGSRVEWVCYPASFAVGAFLTCLAVMGLAAVWTVGRRCGR